MDAPVRFAHFICQMLLLWGCFILAVVTNRFPHDIESQRKQEEYHQLPPHENVSENVGTEEEEGESWLDGCLMLVSCIFTLLLLLYKSFSPPAPNATTVPRRRIVRLGSSSDITQLSCYSVGNEEQQIYNWLYGLMDAVLSCKIVHI